VTATKPCFDDEIKPDPIKRPTTEAIVKATQSHRRLIGPSSKIRIEQSFTDDGGKAPPFRPSGHGTGFLLADEGGDSQNRRALARWRDDIDILQNKGKVLRIRIGEKTESPHISLAEMSNRAGK
jgi:CHASE2 domain-containing sensor protein